MSDDNPIAANDSDGLSSLAAGADGDELGALLSTIEAVLAEADRLELGMIAIHLDHAKEVCRTHISERGGRA